MKFFLASLAALSLGAAELPVRQVILYKHGVGYFERSGELSAGEGARLDFKADEMNDVLKSLTVEVKGGAGVAGLRYDSSIPVEKKLEEIPVKLGEREPLSALLDRLKGARVRLETGGSAAIEGAIVSARLFQDKDGKSEKETVTLLLDSGELRTEDFAAMRSIRFTDPKLQLQLKDYLTALTQARSTDKRSVYIDSSDAGRRQIFASYMIPAPVWKSSYRLILPATGEPILEGWAIVDNTTGEDWSGVKLALVSGRPISFISKLYEPRYITRPGAELPDDAAAAPTVHAGGVVGGSGGGMGGGIYRMAAPPPPPAPNAAAMSKFAARAGLEATDAAAISEVRDQAQSSAVVNTQGRDLGELFEYRFNTPVTIRKNESAMLPFLQQKLATRKLLIYSDGPSQHPLNAAELTNSTGKILDGGPITVYDSGAYAGEALVETVKSGDKRLISYGVDLGTRITTRFDFGDEILQEIHYRRGVLETRVAHRTSKTYTIKNIDAKAKTLIIEHPVRPGHKLVSLKPTETTATAWRFEVKLPPQAEQRFPVDEENLIAQSYAVINLTPDMIVNWISGKNIPASAKQGLQRILDKKRQIAKLDQQIQQNQQQIDESTRDQARIRENLGALNRVAGQQEIVQKYANQLASREADLATLRDSTADLRKQRTAAQSELDTLVEF